MGDDLPYDSRATYELFRLAQVLDPAYAIQADVNQDTLVDLSLLAFLLEEGLADKLTAERAVYKSAARDFAVGLSDVDELTALVLTFWRVNRGEMPSFARVARGRRCALRGGAVFRSV